MLRVSRGGSWTVSSAAHAGLQLAASLELGVELGAEQQGEVGDPQPEQEHDDAGQRAVGLVVAGEVGDVEAERGGGQHPHDDREEGADADPAELRLLDVRSGVVQERHDADRRRRG